MKTLRLALVAAGVLIGGVALAQQDRSKLQVPDGLSFSEFKGYDSWRAVGVSQTDKELKLISANPVMMDAFKKGLPAKGKAFPEGSKITKVEWSREDNPHNPAFAKIPGQLKLIEFIEKDSKRFAATGGWGYATFAADPVTGQLKPVGTGSGCGFACHKPMAEQDYIYTAYPPR
jgi:hypothetical protein